MWKPIEGYESLYEINKEGAVRRLPTNRIRKPSLRKSGYYAVDLYSKNVRETLYIHRLLAIAFLDNPQNLPCVNHKDGNKLNNELSNLEWSTYSDNCKHAYDLGLKVVTEKMRKHAKGLNKLSSAKNPYGTRRKAVIVFDLNMTKLGEYESIKLAAKALDIHESSIYGSFNNGVAKCKGYKFRLLEETK